MKHVLLAAAAICIPAGAALAGADAAYVAVTGYHARAGAIPRLAVATHPASRNQPPNLSLSQHGAKSGGQPPGPSIGRPDGAPSSQVAASDTRLSGAAFMSAATQAMQNDDRQNPAMLWISGGEVLWQTAAGKAGKSCAACHGDARASMRGMAARYPAFDSRAGKVVTLAQRIGMCREGAQQAPPLAPESDDLLSLEAYVAMQSRGMPMSPPQDEKTRAAAERGKLRWQQRIGQLNLSCAQCHDDHWGRKLASAVIPQAHANAYPLYRLEWQALGSLQRRLRNCMNGVRAEAPPYGAPALVELEAWLALRARGMPLETPGVRP